MIVSIEQHVDWIADCIAYLREQRRRHDRGTAGGAGSLGARTSTRWPRHPLPARQFLVHGRQHPRQAAHLHALYRRRRGLPRRPATRSRRTDTRLFDSTGGMTTPGGATRTRDGVRREAKSCPMPSRSQLPERRRPRIARRPRRIGPLPVAQEIVGNLLVRLAVLVIAAIIVVLFATQWNRWVGDSTRQVTDDAYIRGDVTPLSAQVDGYVRHVAVADFQRVKAGDLLVEIDDSDYRAKVAQAEADFSAPQAAIENIKARKEMQHAAGGRGGKHDRSDAGRCRAHPAGGRTAAHTARHHLRHARRGSSRPSPTRNASPRRWPATRPSSTRSAASWRCSIPRNCSCAPTPRPSRRRSISRKSISAIPASSRRSPARSASAACARASMSMPAAR